MSNDRWTQIQDVFNRALECAPTERAAFLQTACAGDAELRREVESLLAYDGHWAARIESAIRTTALSVVDDSLIGKRLGAYLLREEIGRGGMGSVYLAERVDREFQKQAAVKVIRRGLDTADVLERFRYERQILASLDHPGIAHLLDGGTTPDGRPYLVMEYVDGRRIDDYCRDRLLTVNERLQLFCGVCDAVSYAHRNLIVHRDLKPGNILVTADGSPKLLDFGIAKLLSGDAMRTDLTSLTTGALRLTPDYASPEQVLGLPVTTATDIYSLGAVLYELVCDSAAHVLDTRSPDEIRQVVCDVEPPRPSEVARKARLPWARQLEGDLDRIIAMALHKDAERRYVSVDQFSSDIERYLNGLPVVAREDTIVYRTRKFLLRHRFATAGATLAVVSTVAGGVMALHQARQAEAQRQIAEAQRSVAERERHNAESAQKAAEANLRDAQAQRRRAEQRLQELVQLANSSLFGVHDQIARLPGAVDVRRNIVRSTLGYLENLTKDAATDPQLLRSVAAAYARLGDVQGLPTTPSLGDYAGALESYRTADRLCSRLLQGNPDDLKLQEQWLSLQYRIAAVLGETQRTTEAKAVYENALAKAELARKRVSPSDGVLREEAEMRMRLATLYTGADNGKAIPHLQRSIEIASRLAEQSPNDDDRQSLLAIARARLGTAFFFQGQVQEGLAWARRSLEIRKELIRRRPNNVAYLHDLMVAYGRVGDLSGGPFLTGNAGDSAAALENYRDALAIAEKLESLDNRDTNAKIDLAVANMRVGITAQQPDSLTHLRKAAALFEGTLKEAPNSVRRSNNLATTYEYLGRRLHENREWDEAAEAFRRSLALTKEGIRVDPSNVSARVQLMASYDGFIPLLVAAGRLKEAESAALDAIEGARGNVASGINPGRMAPFVPRAYEWLGDVYQAAKDWRHAKQAWTQSAAEWRIVMAQYPATPDGDKQLASVEKLIASSSGP